MKLSDAAYSHIQNELQSCNSIIDLIKKFRKSNKSTPKKKIKFFILILIITLLSILIIKYSTLSDSFETLTSIGLTVSVGLVALIIAGFAILIPSLSKNSVYILLLNKQDNNTKNFSMYLTTILHCLEPMIWISILMAFTVLFKILFLIKDILYFNIYIVYISKFSVIFILIYLIYSSVASLFYFILNMYNFFTSYANFELLERRADNKPRDLDTLLNINEKNFEKLISKNEED